MVHERLPYHKTCGMEKWRKTKEKEGTGYEASACFMARGVSEPAKPL